MNEVEVLVPGGNCLGEGPLWHPVEQALYWVDIEGHCVYRYDRATGDVRAYGFDLPVTVLGRRAAGGFVVATRDGFAFWDPASPGLRFIVDPEAGRPDARFNDGAVDRQGRFWAGTMSPGPTSALYRLDANLSLKTMETGITCSNGIGWSPDNRTMYYTDSTVHLIYAYDFDPATGELANRRPFVRVPDEEGVPDGLAVDTDGFVWSAHWGGWKVSRYDPDGKVERTVRVPVERTSSCAFGGPDMNELYITTAWNGATAAERREQPLAGHLFRLFTDVGGLEAPSFAG